MTFGAAQHPFRTRLVTLAGTIALLLPVAWTAATSQSPATPTGREITFPVVISEKSGDKSPVEASELGLKDDGVPVQQVIGIQAGIGVPLRLGVVMDTSNSERDSEVYRAALRALPKFLDDVLATDDDRVFFATVTSGAELTDFVPRTKLSGLHIDATPGGPTALFDGIAASCDQRMQKDSAGRARRVLVVISDGNDNQSHLKASEAIGFAQKTGTIVFTLSTGEHRSIESRDTAILKKLAQETGGDSFVDLSPRDVPKVLAEIVREIETFRWSPTSQPHRSRVFTK